MLLAGLLGFASYCWLVIDCYLDFKLGRYEQKPMDTLLEAVILLAYCYVAFRFVQSKAHHGPPSARPSAGVAKLTQSLGGASKPLPAARRTKRGIESIFSMRRPFNLDK
ncbi:hypothetical protein GCM10028773_50720 [Spirosoma koreense]